MRAKPFLIGALLSVVVIAAALAVTLAQREDRYEPKAEGRYAVTAGEIENLIRKRLCKRHSSSKQMRALQKTIKAKARAQVCGSFASLRW